VVHAGKPRTEAIASAIERRAFQLVYQPIVDLDSGEVDGVEALCRFRDGRSPTRWFEECEALGMAADLDLAIIDTALADLPMLPGYLSLNVSPSTLLDGRLVSRLCAHGVPTKRLVLEVTEHAPVSNYGVTRQVLDTLRGAGVQLAVDDAGAGYATFRHVLRLHPDIIKMDMSITQHINEDPARLALATALVIFAGEIGAVLIAEGAETQSELAALHSAGVSRAQGFALARPQSLPLTLPVDAARASRDALGRGVGDDPAPGRPPWADHDRDDAAATTAHALLSPVGSIDIALELLRKKTENLGENECVALIGTAQRQVRIVGGALVDIMRGRGAGNLVVLDGVCRSGPVPLTSAAPD
jgi:EAL domain-containing protein (putative c-di-GMP-specific phosphodiesterase class I)